MGSTPSDVERWREQGKLKEANPRRATASEPRAALPVVSRMVNNRARKPTKR